MEDLREARTRGHEIYFITHRFGLAAKLQTEEWLKEQGMTNPTVLIAEKKAQVVEGLQLDVFVDDKPSNVTSVQEANPFTRCYVLDRAYNRHVEGLRVETIRELLNIELYGHSPNRSSRLAGTESK